ncbi:MAG TPA: aminoacyl-tRNA hydrolase [Pirellulales bacterium]|jgi:PTH1 family peptidyl-tRNA hydrolase|nr:aminoacyl-tRNA hydrolase [Pirellulales bacterium]
MKLVVGLGNPGRRYQSTRHNVGFGVLAELARRHGSGGPKTSFQGEVVEAAMSGARVLLLCPHTFMNNSGASVLAARDFYKLENADLLIVCDDFSLPAGKLRLRSKGSAGGQKGLEDIIRVLGSDEVSRLRLGIGPLPAGWDAAAFVLGKFAKEESAVVDPAIVSAADAAAAWVANGIEFCMNAYN